MVKGIDAAPSGRPSYPPVVMVKVMVLQQWYDACRRSDRGSAVGPGHRSSGSMGLGLEDEMSPTTRRSAASRREVDESGVMALRLLQGDGDRQLAQLQPLREEGDAPRCDHRGRVTGEASYRCGGGGRERRARPTPDARFTRQRGVSQFGYNGARRGGCRVRADPGGGADAGQRRTIRNVAEALVRGDEAAVSLRTRPTPSKQRSAWLKSR